MKKIALFIVAVMGMLFATSIAEARPHRAEQGYSSRQATHYRVKRTGTVRSHRTYRSRYARSAGHRVTRARSATYRTARAGNVGGRPRQWCGWWMRTQLGGGPEFNLAWNWSRWGRPAASPQVGAVVVWRHHVGMITGKASNGQWIVKSGNDSNRVRERARSVAGAVFRI